MAVVKGYFYGSVRRWLFIFGAIEYKVRCFFRAHALCRESSQDETYPIAEIRFSRSVGAEDNIKLIIEGDFCLMGKTLESMDADAVDFSHIPFLLPTVSLRYINVFPVYLFCTFPPPAGRNFIISSRSPPPSAWRTFFANEPFASSPGTT